MSHGIRQNVSTRGQVLAKLLDQASQPVVGADFDGQITCLNQAFARLTGFEVEALLGASLKQLAPEELHAGQSRAIEKLKQTASSLQFEGACLRSDGVLIRVEVAAEPDFDESGQLVGLFAFVTDLSARVKAESALRESEDQFRRLYDEAPVGYHEVDTEGRVVNINRAECEMLGYSREEMLGHSVFDFLDDEVRETAKAGFPDKVSGRTPLKTIERTVVTHDGRKVTVSIEERYHKDETGRIVGLLSTVQDISDRKRAELALQASERRARTLFEGIEDAVFVHSLDGRILDANPAASRLLGYSHEELITMRTSEIDDPTFATGYEDRLSQQLALGHLACEGRHRTRDGRILPVEIKTSTIQLDKEKAILAMIRDISERLALEATRREFAEAQNRGAREIAAKNAELTLSEARYRQLTEACLDGVVVADAQGNVTLLNPAAEQMFGYKQADVLGQPLSMLARSRGGLSADPNEAPPTDWDSLVGKTVELVGRRRTGEEFPLELSLSAVDREGDFQYIGSLRDQTERQRMREMLTRSEKLASIGLLSAGVAHEINNPLAYVANNIAVLERDIRSVTQLVELYTSLDPVLAEACPDELRKIREHSEDFDWQYVQENLPRMLSRTREGIQRVANIVSSMRNLARTSPTRMESTRVVDIVESAIEMVRGRLRRHQIKVEASYEEGLTFNCVASQISQVLLNLIINAIQAVEASGKVDGGLIRVAATTDGASIALSVEDNGGGIPEEALPRLFDPFFTTKSVGEGTGLGLSICHGIVNGHGGRIEVENRPGLGSTFRVLLPCRPLDS